MSEQLKRVAEDAVFAIDSVVEDSKEQHFKSAVAILEDAVLAGNSVFFLGIGKSGLVAQRSAATLRSFNIRSVFIHAGDAVHGDIGMAECGDVVIALTHSGKTDEVVLAVKALDDKLGSDYRLIVVTSDRAEADSWLGPEVTLTYEANELQGFAPGASCIAQAVYVDGLIAEVLDKLEIGRDDFKMNHPGGSLGRQLTIDD